MSTVFGNIGMNLLYNQLFMSDTFNIKQYLSVKNNNFSIYGICRIQNFTEISETLQGDTFAFINEIAQTLHSSVYRYGGFSVKNLNDGFLVVFKLPAEREKEII